MYCLKLERQIFLKVILYIHSHRMPLNFELVLKKCFTIFVCATVQGLFRLLAENYIYIEILYLKFP